jgi:RES domain-containing protein
MVLYRICDCKHAHDVSGTGAKLFGGRWNSVGVPLHYMASNRALAALEVLANKSSMSNTVNLCLSVFEVPENSIEVLKVHELPKNWRDYPSNANVKKIGDDFVKRQKSLILAVPSAIIADEYNHLMNVQHPLAKQIKIIEVKSFEFDERLV